MGVDFGFRTGEIDGPSNIIISGPDIFHEILNKGFRVSVQTGGGGRRSLWDGLKDKMKETPIPEVDRSGKGVKRVLSVHGIEYSDAEEQDGDENYSLGMC